MSIQIRKVHHRQDFLCETAARKMQGTATTTIYLAFIDLKTFDLVSRSGLVKLLQRIGCPSTLLGITTSFHTNMKSTVSFNGSTSKPFEIRSGVKLCACTSLTLYGIIFFSLLTPNPSCESGSFMLSQHIVTLPFINTCFSLKYTTTLKSRYPSPPCHIQIHFVLQCCIKF